MLCDFIARSAKEIRILNEAKDKTAVITKSGKGGMRLRPFVRFFGSEFSKFAILFSAWFSVGFGLSWPKSSCVFFFFFFLLMWMKGKFLARDHSFVRYIVHFVRTSFSQFQSYYVSRQKTAPRTI